MIQPDPAQENTNDTTCRLFIALACPPLGKIPELLSTLNDAARGPGSGIRVVPEQNLHITLKFLGSLASSSIGDIAATLDQIILTTRPFDITLVGTGVFKDAFWLGIRPCDVLTELSSIINQRLAPRGFVSETRPFIPHLTVARLAHNSDISRLTPLQQWQHETWGSLAVEAVHLYQSTTMPNGVQYSILHTARFNC